MSKFKILIVVVSFLAFSLNAAANNSYQSSEVSASNSKIDPAQFMARTGSEKVQINVKLLDTYSNPVPGHLVKLISSSGNDVISLRSNNNFTDYNGEIAFDVIGKKNGIVSYSAYDASADVILDSKSRILYFDSTDSIYKTTFAGNSSGPVDHLKFEDVPLSIAPGESVTFKLTAVDDDDQNVINYLGMVRFTVTGADANSVDVPQDYEFTAEDLGSHLFSLALTFQKPGSYKIKATDLETEEVFGEQAFVVVNSGNQPSEQNGSLFISSPSSGTVSNNVQVISGSAPSGARIKIFDNDVPIATLSVDNAGRFSYTTGALAEGQHKIYVAQVNEIDTIVQTSPIVNLNIDLQAPEIGKVELEPKGAVDPATTVKVKLFVSETLSRARLNFGNNVFDMTKNAAGYYEASVVAPIEFGEYNLGFTLTDELGNDASFKDQAKLAVGVMGSKDVKPPAVTNLVATPGPNKVTLNWDYNSSSSIKSYRVYYGTSPNQLVDAVDTLTNADTWYIPNLENGVTYYFAVTPIDSKGNTSSSFDQIVLATPSSSVIQTPPVDVMNGTAGKDALDDLDRDASESGPEVIWLIPVSALAGMFYRRFRRTLR